MNTRSVVRWEWAVRRFITGLTAAVLLLTAAACSGSNSGSGAAAGGSGSAGGGKADITVGTIPIVDVAPIYLGKKKGFFDQQNINLTLQTAQGGAAIVPSVMSGQYQFGFSNVVSLLIAEQNGLPVKVVSPGNSSTGKEGQDFGGIVAPADSPITSAKDLVGKTVAVNNLKNIGDVTVRAAVQAAGGDPMQVKFVELAFPDMPAALANHRVDAAWVVEPFLSASTSQGAKVVSWNLVQTAPNLPISTYFSTTQYISQHPDVVKEFQTAMQQSLDYAQQHPDEARAILADYTKITPEQAAKITLPDWPSTFNKPGIENLASLTKQYGLVPDQPDVTKLLP